MGVSASLFQSLGDLQKAEENYRTALRLKPWFTPTHGLLGGLLWNSGRREEDPGALHQSGASWPGRTPGPPGPGPGPLAAWPAPEALAQYGAALRISPGSAVAHYELGTALLAQGKLAEASARFRQAVRFKPDYTEALTELGKTFAGQNQFEEAQLRFREVVRLCPTNVNAHVNLANALVMAGRSDEAASFFAAATRLQPELPDKFFQAGKTLLAKNQSLTALARFKTALALKPDHVPALSELAWLLATDSLAEVRDGPEAVRLAPTRLRPGRRPGAAPARHPRRGVCRRGALRRGPNHGGEGARYSPGHGQCRGCPGSRDPARSLPETAGLSPVGAGGRTQQVSDPRDTLAHSDAGWAVSGCAG